MLEAQLVQLSAEDLLDVAVGAVFVASGIACIALATFRRRGRIDQFIALGFFALLYGIRLTASGLPVLGVPGSIAGYVEPLITYWLPLVPFAYARRRIGGGWCGTVTLIVAIQAIYAVTATVLDLLHGPEYAMRPNNYLMLASFFILTGNIAHYARRQGLDLRREVRRNRDSQLVLLGFVVMVAAVFNENAVESGLVPWRASHEPLGVLVFFACIGAALAHRLFLRDVEMAGVEHELATARRIQLSILPSSPPKQEGVSIAVQYQPMTAVGGDFYDFHENADGSVTVLVADVSGHGVPAALVASMVKVAFGSQRERAHDPAAVLTGIRDAIAGSGMSRQMVTAGCVVVDRDAREIRYANAGHPPLLLAQGEEVREIEQPAPPIGAFRNAQYSSERIALDGAVRLVLYSDGVTETMNRRGEQFGDRRLCDALRELSLWPVEEAASEMLVRLAAWRGDGREQQDDDITIVLIDVARARE